MDDLPVHTTPAHQTTTLLKWMFNQKLFFTLAAKLVVQHSITVHPPQTAAFSSVYYFSYALKKSQAICLAVEQRRVGHYVRN